MLALGFAPEAAAMNPQPGMLTMVQQGGMEHGVQFGRLYRRDASMQRRDMQPRA